MFNFVISDEPDKNVTDEYIDEVEHALNIKFPAALREFYLNHNFSEQKECAFKVRDIDDYFVLDTIIPLKYGTIPLEKEYKWVLENEYISNDLIPLASDVGGDNFYWHAETGEVCYIFHEDVENPTPICDSVEEFFEILNNSKEFDEVEEE